MRPSYNRCSLCCSRPTIPIGQVLYRFVDVGRPGTSLSIFAVTLDQQTVKRKIPEEAERPCHRTKPGHINQHYHFFFPNKQACVHPKKHLCPPPSFVRTLMRNPLYTLTQCKVFIMYVLFMFGWPLYSRDAGYTSHDSRDSKSQLKSVFIGQTGGSSHEKGPSDAGIKLLCTILISCNALAQQHNLKLFMFYS